MTLRYFISIGAKLFRVVPVYTMGVVLSTLFSQLALLLAFIFPLKVIILLGSPDLPEYFPLSWQNIDRDYFIISFVFASAGFYFLYLLFEKAIVFFSKRGAKILLEKNKKITLFENQDVIAKRAYQRYSRALAALIFLLITLITMSIIYPLLTLSFIGVFILCFALIALGCQVSKKFKNMFNNNIILLVSIIAALAFFLGFTFIVFSFLHGLGPGILGALICLLLMRQVMTRATGFASDLLSLVTQRHQINALFFYEKLLQIQSPQYEKNWWECFEENYRNQVIKDILEQMTGLTLQSIASQWFQIGLPGIMAFEITAKEENSNILSYYFIKIFNNYRQTHALHEASLLLQSNANQLPALEFFGATKFDHYICHVYKHGQIKKIIAQELKQINLDVLESLMFYSIPGKLVQSYKRSKPILGYRLKKDIITGLRYLTNNPEHLKGLLALENHLDTICTKLNSLPVQLVNPDIILDTVALSPTGEAKILHWGRWTLEPLGAGLPIHDFESERFKRIINKAQQTFGLTDENEIKLSALLYSFESFYQRELYHQALDLLPTINALEEK